MSLYCKLDGETGEPLMILEFIPLMVFLYPDMTMVKPYNFCSSEFSTKSTALDDALRCTSNLGSIKTLRWK